MCYLHNGTRQRFARCVNGFPLVNVNKATALRYARGKAKRHAMAEEERQVLAAREVDKTRQRHLLQEKVLYECRPPSQFSKTQGMYEAYYPGG